MDNAYFKTLVSMVKDPMLTKVEETDGSVSIILTGHNIKQLIQENYDFQVGCIGFKGDLHFLNDLKKVYPVNKNSGILLSRSSPAKSLKKFNRYVVILTDLQLENQIQSDHKNQHSCI